MKHSTMILRGAIFIAGIAILGICGISIWLIITETNPNSEYYHLSYIFFAGVFSTTIPFFISLYQAMKLLNYIDTKRAFSEMSVKALRTIMHCAFIIFTICTLGGLPFFYQVAQIDDAPGLVLIGIVIASASFIIAVFAAVLEKLLQDAINIKIENDLTV